MLERMMLSSIGGRIQWRRREKGYSQQQIASHLNVSVSAVSLWEKDKTNITSDKLVKLAEILDCDVEWLIQGEVNKINKKEGNITDEYLNELKVMWLNVWDEIPLETVEDVVHISQLASTLNKPYLKTLLSTAMDLDKQQQWNNLTEDERKNFYNWLKKNK